MRRAREPVHLADAERYAMQPAAPRALSNSGRPRRVPDSISVNSPTRCRSPPLSTQKIEMRVGADSAMSLPHCVPAVGTPGVGIVRTGEYEVVGNSASDTSIGDAVGQVVV